jgi:hypothetical protein
MVDGISGEIPAFRDFREFLKYNLKRIWMLQILIQTIGLTLGLNEKNIEIDWVLN